MRLTSAYKNDALVQSINFLAVYLDHDSCNVDQIKNACREIRFLTINNAAIANTSCLWYRNKVASKIRKIQHVLSHNWFSHTLGDWNLNDEAPARKLVYLNVFTIKLAFTVYKFLKTGSSVSRVLCATRAQYPTILFHSVSIRHQRLVYYYLLCPWSDINVHTFILYFLYNSIWKKNTCS